MYEFLAPWGVLIPMISAAVCYYYSAKSRREKMLEDFDLTPPAPPRSSRPLTAPLSVVNG